MSELSPGREGPVLTLLTPFLNESELLPAFLDRAGSLLDQHPGKVSWVLVDSGSTDDSAKLIREWAWARGGVVLVEKDNQDLRGPSIGRALNHAVRSVSALGEWVQVIPADCELSAGALLGILERLSAGVSPNWYACPKRYLPETGSLKFYAWIQNTIRLGGLGRAVWTNGMAVRRRLLRESPFPEFGFMEDSLWCDALLSRHGRPVCMEPIQVSARRYYPDRTFRRIGINFLVITLYRSARLLPGVRMDRVLPALKSLYLSLK